VNIGLVAATFALIVPAELPDKTFISAIVLSSRHRPLPVWFGVASALILQAGIAVVLGRLLALLPHRVVEGVVAALFLAGAAYLLFVPERAEVERGEELAEREEEELSEGALGQVVPSAEPSSLRIASISFGVIALAEFGDLTQVLIANLTAKYKDPWSVFLGAAIGFIAISAFGVLAGRAIIRIVPIVLVRKIAGLALGGLGIWSLVGAISG
jgi:putative Ca2+/H+ antiporter (TMEM165/GDT1 family)